MQKLHINKTFTVKKEKLDYKRDDEFGRLVQSTAKLLKRSFVSVYLMVERDKLEAGFLAALHDSCLAKWRDLGFESPSHMWWTERKKSLGRKIDASGAK